VVVRYEGEDDGDNGRGVAVTTNGYGCEEYQREQRG